MISKQFFGSTKHKSSVTLFGAAALGNVSQEVADKVLELLIEYGVNHIDTAASYGDSELRIGPWMKGHRDRFFLATKTGDRTYSGAKKEINDSLKRLQVGSVDLLQLHNLVHPDDWDKAMREDGALKAATEARNQGLVKYIGVTGHGLLAPAMHKRSLERYEFDSVLMPWNYPLYRNARYRKEFEELIEMCRDRGVAVQTIKSVTKGPWAEKQRTRRTWYEPLEAQEDIDLAVSWIIGQEGIFLNTAGDVDILPRVLDAAKRHEKRPSDSEMDGLVDARKMTSLFVS
jgi:aryl-alcohol dehydrogenase-like predicted oxidoreductase